MKRGCQAGLMALLLAAATPLSAYFHFLRYQSRFSPFQPLVEKFDLTALPAQTVRWYLNGAAQPLLAQGDTMTAVLSQIQAAAQVWNGVATSELRLAYGGQVTDAGAVQGPWIEVTFDELPPGLIAMGGPVTRADVTGGPATPFIPIVKSLLVLQRELTARPSYSERFFLNVVHEFGHTLGLQHSWTSGVMSTEITRATTKGSPLSPDDVAGISALYPARTFAERHGAISGRVLLDGAGAHLASVLAIPASGPAISALTLPDGSYRIEGVPPGTYHLHVHPLPPPLPGEPEPVNLVLPQDPAGPVSPAPFFGARFWPGTPLPQQTVTVSAGGELAGMDFAVTRQGQQTIHSVQTYSFFTAEPVKPATLWRGRAVGSVVLSGYGLQSASGEPLPGLSFAVVGGPEQVRQVIPYGPDRRFLQVDLNMNAEAVPGDRHLILSLNGETHLAPSAIRIVEQQPPAISSVAPAPERTLLLWGTNLSRNSTVWFDGVRAAFRSFEDSVLRVQLPLAPNGHVARIAVTNPDGQSSLQMLGAASPTFQFEQSELGAVNLNAPSLAQGTDSVIELSSVDARLGSAGLQLFFGNSDIAVRRVIVAGADRVWVQIAVDRQARPGFVNAFALAGLQPLTLGSVFIQAPGARAMFVSQNGQPPLLTAGSIASIPVNNLPSVLIPATSFVQLNGITVPVTGMAGGQVLFSVPPGAGSGAALLRITINGEPVQPAVVTLAEPPPVIQSLRTLTGGLVGTILPAQPNMLYQMVVTNFLPVDAPLAGVVPRVYSVLPNGTTVDHIVLQVQPAMGQAGAHSVFLALNSVAGVTELPLTLSWNGRTSAPFTVQFRP